MFIVENKNRNILLLRVFLGFSILKDFCFYFYNREFLFDKNGIVSYQTYQDIINFYKLFTINIDFNNDLNIIFFCILGILLSFLFILGVCTRISTVGLLFLLFVFKFRNVYLMDGADNVITAILPFFIFLKSDSLIESYNRFKRKFLKDNYYINEVHRFAILAIMIQICMIYFFAGLHKLQGGLWVEGTALYYILQSADFSAYSINKYVTQSPFVVKLLTWFTIFFQLTFPFLVWISKTRVLFILIGIIFHLGIFILMRIDNFSFIMIISYLIFLKDNDFDVIKSKLKNICI